jgi:hypothetical protein
LRRLALAAASATALAFGLGGGTATGGAPPSADLSVSVSDAPDPASVGRNVTYTVTVRNAGPATGKRIVLTTSRSGRHVLGTLRKGAKATLRVVVVPAATGPLSLRASVSSKTRDPRRRNNSFAQTTRVIGTDTVQGHGVRPVFGSDGGAVTIDLDASSAYDGTGAAGTFATRYPNGDPELHGHVVCLAVAGNKAMVGGVVESVTGSNPGATPVGSGALFSVTDNGTTSDTELTFLVLASQGCGIQDAIPEIPLSEGNFTIHDEIP